MLTAPDTVSLLTRLVAEHGAGRVERSLVYVARSPKGWAPTCLVGHVLVEAGVPLDVLVRYNSVCVSDLRRLGQTFTPAALALLNIAQRCQDEGMPWGEVLDEVRLRAIDLSGQT